VPEVPITQHRQDGGAMIFDKRSGGRRLGLANLYRTWQAPADNVADSPWGVPGHGGDRELIEADMKQYLFAAGVILGTSPAIAGSINSERFGYTATVTQYATLADAEADNNPTNTINIGDRDAGIFVTQDSFIFMGTWWYTTVNNTDGTSDVAGDRFYSGWGNTRGNTGLGFAQLFDTDGTSLTSLSANFDQFDGTFWTEFNLSASGENAGASESSRLSLPSNNGDGGIYHSYDLNMTVQGLEGQVRADGQVEATDLPSSVTGSYSGVFEGTGASNTGFYRFDFDITLENWAFAQGNDALNGDWSRFGESFVAAPIPEPLAAIGGISLLSIVGLRRRHGSA
jgi:hypothetical protein